MKLLARYIEGDRSFIPENKLIIVPTRVINKDNVAEFRDELKALLSGGK
jgi:ribose transport system substrate-binding protein